MDLLAIGRTLWRFKIPALVVVIVTLIGCAGVVFLIPPVYETTSSYLLLPPPPAPTDQEIAKDPDLGKIRADNPYQRFSDPSVIINVVARRVNEDRNRERMIALGADNRFLVAPSNRYGFSSPIIDITSEAGSPEEALKTLRIVGDSVTRELKAIQATDVDPKYTYKARPVEAPDGAKQRASGKLRALLGVLGLGMVSLLVMVSSLQAWDRRKRQRLGLPEPYRPQGYRPESYPPSPYPPASYPPDAYAPDQYELERYPPERRRPEPHQPEPLAPVQVVQIQRSVPPAAADHPALPERRLPVPIIAPVPALPAVAPETSPIPIAANGRSTNGSRPANGSTSTNDTATNGNATNGTATNGTAKGAAPAASTPSGLQLRGLPRIVAEASRNGATNGPVDGRNGHRVANGTGRTGAAALFAAQAESGSENRKDRQ